MVTSIAAMSGASERCSLEDGHGGHEWLAMGNLPEMMGEMQVDKLIAGKIILDFQQAWFDDRRVTTVTIFLIDIN